MSSSSAAVFSFPPHRPPDDTVTYSLHPPLPPNAPSTSLLSFHRHILSLLPPHLSSYIWHRDPFHLSLPPARSPAPCSLCRCPPSLPHLHGRARFADAVADEWFIVSLLLYLTKQVPGLAVRVWDSDGEFLLIEAAFALPRWVNPENSANRVFLYGGDVHIVPKKVLPDTPSLEQALCAVKDDSVETRAPDAVQLAIRRRLEGLPERAMDKMHRVRVRMPVAAAQVLRVEPCLVALAVEGFYDRDMDMMKHAAKMEKFLGSNKVDMVRVSVVMSKIMYAQLLQQRFQAPRCYAMPSRDEVGNDAWMEAELGMKLACGLEMMYQEKRISGEESKSITWELFKENLEQSGYLEGLLPGTEEYKKIHEELLEYYKSTSLFYRTREILHAPVHRIDEILSMAYTASEFSDMDLCPNDDDSWLYSGEDELNSEIMDREKELEEYKAAKTHNKGTKQKLLSDDLGTSSSSDFNLADITESMQEFVRKISSFEGAEVPDKRQLRPVEFDADRFLKDMESALGLTKEVASDDEHDRDSSSGMDFDDDFDDDFADESGGMEGSDDTFMQSYSAALEKELVATTLQKSFARAQHPDKNTECASSSGKMDEDLAPVDVDLNLVESFLSSYSSQQGLPGPASNLLGLMGVKVPPDSK